MAAMPHPTRIRKALCSLLYRPFQTRVRKPKGGRKRRRNNQEHHQCSQSPSVSHPPEEQVSLPCCTVAFKYSCSPLVRSRTY